MRCEPGLLVTACPAKSITTSVEVYSMSFARLYNLGVTVRDVGSL